MYQHPIRNVLSSNRNFVQNGGNIRLGGNMVNRDRYLRKLIKKQGNGMIKIIAGIRRCGKSVLLFDLFYQRLIDLGVPEENIVTLALDTDENECYRNPHALSEYVRLRCADKTKKYYVFLDEIQYAISAEELRKKDRPPALYSVLNGFLHMGNIDVYVTGSNSKLLSKDIATEFRGRGDVIQIYPFSFQEFSVASGLSPSEAYNEYAMYGGMPYLLNLQTDEDKYDYLNRLFEEIYFKDIEERYEIRLSGVLRDLTSCLCSSIGSLTNASNISHTLASIRGIKVDSETIGLYIEYLNDCFLFSRADRYDVKGRKYFSYPSKYYCTDIGLRNVRLGLRQMEPTHIMENIIYNELLNRGYYVDVGNIQISESVSSGRYLKKNLEIDFIARKGSRQYYIQSALNMDDEHKEAQEIRPLLAIKDSFRKIVVSKSYGKSWFDDYGILHIGLTDFLLDQNSLER